MIGRVDPEINCPQCEKLQFEKNAFEHLPMTENASARSQKTRSGPV